MAGKDTEILIFQGEMMEIIGKKMVSMNPEDQDSMQSEDLQTSLREMADALQDEKSLQDYMKKSAKAASETLDGAF